MGEPIKVMSHHKALYEAQDEMRHAVSSLCMPDDPLKDARPDAFYLTDKYQWAAHAEDHMFAALDNMAIVGHEIRHVAEQLRRMALVDRYMNEEELREQILSLSIKLEEMT
jgi:hypothetical protein